MEIEDIARVAHDACVTYSRTQGDYANAYWLDAPDWQRESVLVGVRAVIADPEATPERQHALWTRYKQLDGWTYGPVKCAAAKTHPNLVEYGELPESQRVKDALFIGIVKVLSAGGECGCGARVTGGTCADIA